MSKVKDAEQAGDPDPASVLMGLTVAWNMYGFATGFFEKAWKDAPIPVTPSPTPSTPPSPSLRRSPAAARGGQRSPPPCWGS